MTAKITATSIVSFGSVLTDNKRRGEPKPGCDCVQCFGMCIVEHELAVRHRALLLDGGLALLRGRAPLDFGD